MNFLKKLFGMKECYRIGDRIRIKNTGHGTVKPSETGYSEPVLLEEKGREGTIIKFKDGGIPIVKWDAGVYRTSHGTVQLAAFEASIHPDWIAPASEPLPESDSEPALDIAAVADPSSFECKRCHKVGSHRRVSDQYAGDLWVCPSCGYKTPRPLGI